MLERVRQLGADVTLVTFAGAVAVGYALVQFASAVVRLALELISPPPGFAESFEDQPFTIVVGDRVIAYEDVVHQAAVLLLVVLVAAWLLRRYRPNESSRSAPVTQLRAAYEP